MFNTLQDRLNATFKNLRGKGRLSESDIDATCREIRIALLEADVALPAVREFIARVRERAKGAEVSEALNPAQQVIKIVNDELITILGGETRRLRFAKNPPTVIMLAGLQGSGKTTLAGKLGRWLKETGHSPMLVAADLQRPNAVNQLEVVGAQAGVTVFAPERGNGVGDPVAVARAAVAEAKRRLYDVIVVDTAGRLGIDAELMRQAADIRDAVQPDETLFVVDAMIGQDAVATAQAFLDGVGFTGVVLSKLDGDARGGAALSVAQVTGRQVMFASNGEKLTDFDVFHPDRMASRILGMGDMLTLIEQAEKAFDSESAAKAAAKLQGKGGDFTLDDFLEQMQAVRKMGSLSKIMGMIPGMAQFRDQLENFDDREIDRIQALILSMTPAERANPKIIDGSRRTRIARGAGRAVSDVNSLVDRFFEARKMMMSMAGGGGMAGCPACRACRGWAARGRRPASSPPRSAASAGRATPPSGPPRFTPRPLNRPSRRPAAPPRSASAGGVVPRRIPRRRRRPRRRRPPAVTGSSFRRTFATSSNRDTSESAQILPACRDAD